MFKKPRPLLVQRIECLSRAYGQVVASDVTVTPFGMLHRFINNTADVLGGAINHVGSQSDRLAITGSTFTGNAAGEFGT